MTTSEAAVTLVSDRRRTGAGGLVALAGEAARAGVDYVQVREKDLVDRDLRALVADVVAVVAGTQANVLVNGRPDVAEVTGAAGVQLPEEGLPVAAVKRAFPRLVVGASRHSLEGARRAEDEGADFVVLGPVFPTPGKQGRSLGVEVLAQAARSLRIPVHAIGGINAASAPRAVAAGARGLAAIRIFLEGPLRETVRALKGP